MRGIGLLAGYFAREKGLTGKLFVCESLNTFRSEIEKVAASPQDHRCAYIVPSWPGVTDPDRPQNNHKVAVGIEKQGNRISIVFFDPFSFGVNPASRIIFLGLHGSISKVLDSNSKADKRQVILNCASNSWAEEDSQGVLFQTVMKAQLPISSQCTMWKNSPTLRGKIDSLMKNFWNLVIC